MKQLPSVNLADNALNPYAKQKFVKVQTGQRISTVLREIGYLSGRGASAKRSHPFYVEVNGKPVLFEGWGYRIRASDTVNIVNLPKGGGGGSNPLQIVMMIAVVVAAVYTGGAVGAAYGAGYGAAAQAGVMVAGMAIISLVTPTPSLATNMGKQETSPTYSINAQGNAARLGQAIPVSYGEVNQFPDYAAAPYTEINGSEQYLYQLFVLTQGHTQINQIFIENTPVEQFTGVQMQVVQPGEAVTLFPSNVYTVPEVNNNELVAPNLGGTMVGPFVAVPIGEKANALGFDISFPRGAFRMDSKGKQKSHNLSYMIEYQRLDDTTGNPVGNWILVTNETVTFNTEQPQFRSYRIDVEPGRYQVRAIRLSSNEDNKQIGEIRWANVRSYMPGSQRYGDVTLLAMIIKATNQINQNIQRRVRIRHTRRLRTWNPVDGWSASMSPTRNPAWALADMASNPIYGPGYGASKIDMFELYRLSQVWAQRGDNFDFVFDGQIQFWEALSVVARVGRAYPLMSAGMLSFVRTEPKTMPSFMFSPNNIVKDTFDVEYSFSDGVSTPDYVIAEYTNPETNQPETVDCILPGMAGTRPGTLKLLGCTSRDQAWREGISLAAANRDQRKVINFTTERAGSIPRVGDLVRVSHDMPAWGYSGKVLGFNPTSDTIEIHDDKGNVIDTMLPFELRTTEDMPFLPGIQHSIAFQKRNGAPDGPHRALIHPSGDRKKCIISTANPRSIYISDGIRQEMTGYQFGPDERRGLSAIVISAAPDERGRVRMALTNYAESVHTAETGSAPLPGPDSNLPEANAAPIIDSVKFEPSAYSGEYFLRATPANGASYYEFQTSVNGTQWQSAGVSPDPYIKLYLSPGTYWGRVRAFGRAMGPWATTQQVLDGTVLPIPEIIAASATQNNFDTIVFSWVVDPDMEHAVSKFHVFYSTNDTDRESSVSVGSSGRSFTYHTDKFASERWFWIQVEDTDGRLGQIKGPYYGKSTSDANYALDMLEGEIGQNQFVQALNEKIDRIDTLTGDVEGLWAGIEHERQERVNADSALASDILDVQAGVGETMAAVQVVAQAQSDFQGKVAANYAIKVQVDANGNKYAAGMSLDVSESVGGDYQSTVAFVADRFVIMNQIGGSLQSPFMVVNGQVLIRQALIGDAWITNAHIQNAAITNAKIADAQITASKIGYAQINNTHIADAQITMAKIGVAQIDTLRLTSGAVTTGQSFGFSIQVGRSSGTDAYAYAVYMPYGGTGMIFMNYSFVADWQNSRCYARCDTDGYLFLDSQMILTSEGKPEWQPNHRASYITATYGGAFNFQVTVWCQRPVTGYNYYSGRIAMLGLQR
ncbi:PF09327 domain protein [Achromobacter phage phiAxp-1]|uniref:central tail fiber J n=1 Tax=Achromobacter phage phiAxp-1 TaxID=1610509 RepID=UPI000654F4B7|nr:central tail fiber J [Achromobacter phage phiAxp-1]AKJ71384.1 PF09327 domain protein [Achromobacter phage phiAxp-1]